MCRSSAMRRHGVAETPGVRDKALPQNTGAHMPDAGYAHPARLILGIAPAIGLGI